MPNHSLKRLVPFDTPTEPEQKRQNGQQRQQRQQSILGIKLPPEIILNIVEEMGWDPISIGKFMRTSTATAQTISAHETSLCAFFARDVPHYNEQGPILSSAPLLSTYAHAQPIEDTLRRLEKLYFMSSKLFFSTHGLAGRMPSFASFSNAFYATTAAIHRQPVLSATAQNLVLAAYHEGCEAWQRNNSHMFFDTQRIEGRERGMADETGFVPLPKIATPLQTNTFVWVEELHLRRVIKDHLPGSSLLDLAKVRPEDILRILFRTAQPLSSSHAEAIERFKKRGIEILYRMWDARVTRSSTLADDTEDAKLLGGCAQVGTACTLPSECEARDNVEDWIMAQSEGTLACLLQTVWFASQLYDYSSHGPLSSHCEHGSHDPSSTRTHTAAERSRHWELVERQCIFRELCFEAGPWFLFCARKVKEQVTETQEDEWVWARDRLDKGVRRLHAYERGAPLEGEEMARDDDSTTALDGDGAERAQESAVPRKTLQATLLQRFCELRRCDLRLVWSDVLYVNSVEIAAAQKEIDAKKRS